MIIDVKQIGERVERETPVISRIRSEIHKVIVGQEELIDGLLMVLFCNNYVLIEGCAGPGKNPFGYDPCRNDPGDIPKVSVHTGPAAC